MYQSSNSATSIFELLVMTDSIREMLRENPNPTAIKQQAIKGGLRSIQQDGLLLVAEGKTSIQELLRVSK